MALKDDTYNSKRGTSSNYAPRFGSGNTPTSAKSFAYSGSDFGDGGYRGYGGAGITGEERFRITQAEQAGALQRTQLGIQSQWDIARLSAQAGRQQAGLQAQTAMARLPTYAQSQAAVGEARGGLQEMLARPGIQQAWGQMQPLTSGAFGEMRGRPEAQAVTGTLLRGLSPSNIKAESARLLKASQAALGAQEANEMRRLRQEGVNLSGAERRRYSRDIRESFARLRAALPIQVDEQIQARVQNMLGQGVSYALGTTGQEAGVMGTQLAQAGRFGLSAADEAAMRGMIAQQAMVPTQGQITGVKGTGPPTGMGPTASPTGWFGRRRIGKTY